jgi:hypothetical protein
MESSMSRLILRAALSLALAFGAVAGAQLMGGYTASAQSSCTALGGSYSESASGDTTTVTIVSFCDDGSFMVYTLTTTYLSDGSYYMSGRSEYYQVLDLMPLN